jgi:hypothetical protein
LPASEEVLIAAIHLPSKLYWSEDSLHEASCEISRAIRDEEQKAGHSRTILVGDLNMNPFEKGVVGALGLHGVMTREIAARRSRTIQGTEHPFFYNPMWRCLSDASPGPSGSFYYERAEYVNYFWNTFDQVLIRPDLLSRLPDDCVEILTSAGGQSLLSPRGHPDGDRSSDHLPVLFRLNL